MVGGVKSGFDRLECPWLFSNILRKIGDYFICSQSFLSTGRGKMKNMGPVIAAGIMKIGMIGVLAFKALALLVGKALLVSKLAFLLAAVIGLKKLFSQERHVTYEVLLLPVTFRGVPYPSTPQKLCTLVIVKSLRHLGYPPINSFSRVEVFFA